MWYWLSILQVHHGMPSSYNSPQIQNDLTACVGEWLRNKIISRVKTANFFPVIADEAVDCSNKEQLSLVVSIVDNTNTIQEEFILCDSGTTGSAI